MFRLFNKIMQALIFLSFYSLLTVCIYAQLKQIDLQNSIRYNEKTKIPAAIYNVNSRQYSGTPEVIARQYLLENKTLFRLKDNLDDIRITEVKQSPAGHHVGFLQNYKGIPVMRSETVVSINHQNRISMVVNGYKPNIFVNTNPGINKEQALLLAKKTIDAVNSKEVFPSKEELMVYEDSVNIFHLVWKFFISPLEKGGEWLVVIDAHSGKVLEKFNTAFDYVYGKGRVFDPDPVTVLRDPSLTDQNDADYPAIQPAYKDNVTLNDLNDAVGGLYYVRGRYGWSMDVRPPYDAVSTSDHPDNFRYKRNQNGFEEVVKYTKDFKSASNWIMTEVMKVLNERKINISQFHIVPEWLGELIHLVNSGTISSKIAKDVFSEMLNNPKNPTLIVEEKNWMQVSDVSFIEKIIDEVITENGSQVQQFLSGKEKVFGFFVGEVMKRTQGKANPAIVNDLLKTKLAALKNTG